MHLQSISQERSLKVIKAVSTRPVYNQVSSEQLPFYVLYNITHTKMGCLSTFFLTTDLGQPGTNLGRRESLDLDT